MGNNQNFSLIEQQAYRFPVRQYEQISLNIFQHRKYPTKQLRKYSIVLDDQTSKKNFEYAFHLRNCSDYLLRAEHFEFKDDDELCSCKRKGFIYIQNQQLKLADIKQIPFPDYLHLYDQCLKGFQQLYQRYGAFTPEQQHVCINSDAVVKVWHNHNLQAPQPEHPMSSTAQIQMLRQMFFMLKRNIDYQQTNKQISLLFENLENCRHFGMAISILHQWCKKNSFFIPGKLDCVEKKFLILVNKPNKHKDLIRYGIHDNYQQGFIPNHHSAQIDKTQRRRFRASEIKQLYEQEHQTQKIDAQHKYNSSKQKILKQRNKRLMQLRNPALVAQKSPKSQSIGSPRIKIRSKDQIVHDQQKINISTRKKHILKQRQKITQNAGTNKQEGVHDLQQKVMNYQPKNKPIKAIKGYNLENPQLKSFSLQKHPNNQQVMHNRQRKAQTFYFRQKNIVTPMLNTSQQMSFKKISANQHKKQQGNYQRQVINHRYVDKNNQRQRLAVESQGQRAIGNHMQSYDYRPIFFHQ